MTTTENTLEQVADLARRQRQAGDDLREAVRRARADGESWTTIGDAVGITRQSARERFRTVDQEVGA